MSGRQQRSRTHLLAGTLITAGILAGSAVLAAAPRRAAKPKAPVTRKPTVKPVAAAPAPQFSPEGVEFFEKKVRPILVESCQGCHNVKLASPMGGLRLDTRALAMKGGDRGPSVVPGNLEKSLLIRAVHYNDRTLQMPPKGKLKPDQIEALEAWIKMGAPWPGS
ncbi:MAG: c-type cytochrome domain-containing protein, partial [Actinomycetota bacterium]